MKVGTERKSSESIPGTEHGTESETDSESEIKCMYVRDRIRISERQFHYPNQKLKATINEELNLNPILRVYLKRKES